MSLTNEEMFEIKQRAFKLLEEACHLLYKNRNTKITIEEGREHFLADMLLVCLNYPTRKEMWISFTKESLYEPRATINKFPENLSYIMPIW